MLISAASSYASEEMSDLILNFEESPFKDTPIYCEDRNYIAPKDSDFNILKYALMSSNEGDRYALITIKNKSTGQRIMTSEHLVAILASCTTSHPINFEHRFNGSEIITKEVNFGFSRFPIVKIITEL